MYMIVHLLCSNHFLSITISVKSYIVESSLCDEYETTISN